MTNILDTVAESQEPVTPSSPREYLALQIARRLGNLDARRQYMVLFEHYPEELLIQVFRKCLKYERPSTTDFMRVFRELIGQEP
jgi:hypothetical protein